MAVTSCASAELIAVSSILTFDIYKTYIRPTATPTQLIATSHYMICVFGLTMAIFACIWNAIGIDLGWLFLVMGLVIGGAVFPTAFAITWTGQTRFGAISGCLTGLASGVTSWLVTASKLYGPLSVATTGMEYPTLAGNLAAVIVGGVVSVTVSLIWKDPAPFDWEITRAINAAVVPEAEGPAMVAGNSDGEDGDSDAKEISASPNGASEKPIPNPESDADAEPESEKPQNIHTQSTLPHLPLNYQPDIIDENPHSPALKSALRLAWWAASILSLIMIILVPIPMFLSHYVFSEGFFTAWVIVSFMWVFGSAATSIVLPVVETRGFFVELGGRVWGDVRGLGRRS